MLPVNAKVTIWPAVTLAEVAFPKPGSASKKYSADAILATGLFIIACL